jgi:Lon protease-like protein
LLLFPLKTVLFPGSQLGLKVFEARYLDLVSECLRTKQPFGVICLQQGSDADRSSQVELEDVGVLAHIEEVDSPQPGILRLRCKGGRRFRRTGALEQRANGLWVSPATALGEDPVRVPGPAVFATVQALQQAIAALREQDQLPFAEPFLLNDAGWVANRWCEILPLPLAAKQKLMALEDPVIRLSLVDGFLRDRQVIIGDGTE